MTISHIPKRIIRTMICQGYFIPSLLVWIWTPAYGRDAWIPATLNSN